MTRRALQTREARPIPVENAEAGLVEEREELGQPEAEGMRTNSDAPGMEPLHPELIAQPTQSGDGVAAEKQAPVRHQDPGDLGKNGRWISDVVEDVVASREREASTVETG